MLKKISNKARVQGELELKIKDFELRLDYKFHNKDLALEALSHPSAKLALGKDYERLEFLGDKVIGLIAAESLLNSLPKAPEGELSKKHSFLVCQSTLASLAIEIGLPEAMLLAYGEEKEGGRLRQSNLANAMEATAGAIYQDGGIEPIKSIMIRLWSNMTLNPDSDPKSTLQEILQAYHGLRPTYVLMSITGPGHKQSFEVSLELPNGELIRGSGHSRKEAEREAASKAIERLRAHGEF